MTDGQWSPLDESGVEPSCEAQSQQGGLESGLCPKTHHVRDAHELASSGACFHLAVDQVWLHLPAAPLTTQLEPLAKVGSEGREGEIEPITGEERDTAGSQKLSQRVNDPMGHVLCAGTELRHRQNLGERIDG
jgi:hypothetical protein